MIREDEGLPARPRESCIHDGIRCGFTGGIDRDPSTDRHRPTPESVCLHVSLHANNGFAFDFTDRGTAGIINRPQATEFMAHHAHVATGARKVTFADGSAQE